MLLSVMAVVSLIPFQSTEDVQFTARSQLQIPHQVWAFYKASFSNPSTDSSWRGWTRDEEKDPREHSQTILIPELGFYSTQAPGVIPHHFRQMKDSHIDVVVAEAEFKNRDLITELLDNGAKFGLKLAMLYEPPSESFYEAAENLIQLFRNLSSHKALLKITGRPVLCIRNPSKIKNLFATVAILNKEGFNPALFGTFETSDQLFQLHEDGFMGVISFEPVQDRVWSSNTTSWKDIAQICQERGLLFVPTVSPGYDETAINFWSAEQKKKRENGEYYRGFTKAALDLNPSIILVNSFNDWLASTQIEPAVPTKDRPYTSDNWMAPNGGPASFLELTKELFEPYTDQK